MPLSEKEPLQACCREYIVTTEQLPTRRQLKDLEAGMELDGELVQPISVQPETSDPAHKNRLRIIVAEGRNREVWAAS